MSGLPLHQATLRVILKLAWPDVRYLASATVPLAMLTGLSESPMPPQTIAVAHPVRVYLVDGVVEGEAVEVEAAFVANRVAGDEPALLRVVVALRQVQNAVGTVNQANYSPVSDNVVTLIAFTTNGIEIYLKNVYVIYLDVIVVTMFIKNC